MDSELDENRKVKIIADDRERSDVVRQLSLRGDVDIDLKRLEVGDFICSDRVAFERKSVEDFIKSLMDKKLFTQIRELKNSFECPILLIEGVGIYRKGNAHPNAVAGALASIAVDYRIPMLWSENAIESAQILYWTARREQFENGRVPAIRAKKKAVGLNDEMEFVVAGLPGVSTLAARRILRRFRTLKGVFSASDEELREVEMIGEKKAKRIWELVNAEYPENEDTLIR